MGEARRKQKAGVYFGQHGWVPPEENPKPGHGRTAFVSAESPEEVQARAKVRKILAAVAGIALAGGMSLPRSRR